MDRRTFLTLPCLMALPTSAKAYSSVPYAPTTWRNIVDTGNPMIVNFRASWSLTCQIKADMIADLIADNPEYRQLTFVDVDWDTFGPSQWAQRLKVKRRSTLIAMKGKREIARIEAEPFESRIKALLDTALNA